MRVPKESGEDIAANTTALHKMIQKIHDMLELQRGLHTQTDEKQVKTQAKLDVMQGQLDNIYKRLDRLGLVDGEQGEDTTVVSPSDPSGSSASDPSGSSASGSSDGYKPVCVFIKLLTGKMLTVLVDPKHDGCKFLIDLVRAKAADDMQIGGIVLASVKVILKTQLGKTLDESQPLHYYGLQKEAVLHEMLQLQGGAAKRIMKKQDKLAISSTRLEQSVRKVVVNEPTVFTGKCEELIRTVAALSNADFIKDRLMEMDTTVLEKLQEKGTTGDADAYAAKMAGVLLPQVIDIGNRINMFENIRESLVKGFVHQYASEFFSDAAGQYEHSKFWQAIDVALKEKSKAAEKARLAEMLRIREAEIRAELRAEFEGRAGGGGAAAPDVPME